MKNTPVNIAVCNQKGGIGKSTFTVLLASYLHYVVGHDTLVVNLSSMVDSRRFVVADRKMTKRTAQQQGPIDILRACNDPVIVRGRQRLRTVFALPKLTIADDKVLLLEIIDKDGARHQTVEIGAKELLAAQLL